MSEKTAKPKAFGCYLDNMMILDHLSDSEAGQLWKMLYNLAVNDIKGESDDPLVSMAYAVMSRKLISDFEAYDRKVQALRKNGKKGGEAFAEKKEQDRAKQSNCSQYKEEEENKEEEKEEEKKEEEHKEEEKEENKKEKKKTSAETDADSAAAADVISLYNSVCVSLPRVTELTERHRLLLSKLPPMDFAEYFRRVERSDFLTGRSGKWKGCSFDWLLRPDTARKVRGGMYDNRAAPESAARASYDIDSLERIDTLDFIE